MKYHSSIMEEDNAVVQIRVKKCNGTMKPEYKKMSVDPSLTSFDVLQTLLVRAFDIKSNFSISYLSTDDKGVDVYLSMLSDWDLEAAIATSCNPYLCLKVDLKYGDRGAEEWEIIQRPDIANKVVMKTLSGGTILNNFIKSISKVFGLKQEEGMTQMQGCIPLMSDVQFRMFQNKVGCLIHRDQFKLAVFQSGVEESLRKVVWRHLLDVYPGNLNGQERLEHLRIKSNEYYELRDGWKARLVSKILTVEEKQVMNTVKKDVLRTDRHHSFFSGADDNKSSLMLLNILVTYAFTHPEVSYCQGMSDLASPLLVIQKDEASAYVCFCSLMLRLRNNFLPHGIMMTLKFKHLSLVLERHDPEFAARLKNHRLEADLFFCYRWILLEMKREFPLDEAAYVMEVMWSTLPTQLPGSNGIPLADPDFLASSTTSSHARPSSGYINLKRKFSAVAPAAGDPDARSPSRSDTPSDETPGMETVDVHFAEYLELEKKSLAIEKSLESSLQDIIASTQEHKDAGSCTPRGEVKAHEHLKNFHPHEEVTTSSPREKIPDDESSTSDSHRRATAKTSRSTLRLDLLKSTEDVETKDDCEESHLLDSSEKEDESEDNEQLPPPHEFGHGNPFLMFLCLSLLLQYRDRIMNHKMDYNDVAMFFDRMVRRHDAKSVVSQARILYCAYIKNQRNLAGS